MGWLHPLYQPRHEAMVRAYGFGLFPVPNYREAAGESWRVRTHKSTLARGYASAGGLEAPRHVLSHGRTPWMSTGLMERESHAWHVHRARGSVVVAGLGLGMYAFAVTEKPEVTRVVVLEQSGEVIALLHDAGRVGEWPGRDKLCVLQGDARDAAVLRAARDEAGRPDYLYADLWDDIAAPQAAPDTAALVAALDPVAAGWWGQELAFGRACHQHGGDPTAAALEAFAAASGVPIPVETGYLAFCRDVMTMHGLTRSGGLLAALRRWWG